MVFACDDVGLYSHPNQDWQRSGDVFEVILLRLYAGHVVALTLLVSDGIRAQKCHVTLDTSVDCEVIRGEFESGGQSNLKFCDILGFNFEFD